MTGHPPGYILRPDRTGVWRGMRMIRIRNYIRQALQAAVLGVLPAAAVLLPATAMAGPAVTPLVGTEWLRQHLGDPQLRILDIRSGNAGAAAFEAAHIPGALRSEYPGDWHTQRNGVPWALPEVADLELGLSVLGIGPDTTVVVVPAGTDATDLGGATWIYWVLTHLGHDAVAVLDGGYAAWAADPANPTESGPGTPPEMAVFTAQVRPEILISTADMKARLGNPGDVVIDARSPDQYAGTGRSGLATRPGHIPGALNLDNATLFDSATHRLKPKEALAALFPAAASEPGRTAIFYCNAGHWSSIEWFAFHQLLGHRNSILYADSMAGWTRDATAPLVTGPEPR